MKKVFMPSIDELYKMQDMGVNVYKYLLVKAIETLAVDGVNYPNKGMLKSSYKYLRENPYIAPAICMMYPHEIKYSEAASTDINLCLGLLEERPVNKCRLDYLSKFDSTVLCNNLVLANVVVVLEQELKHNPKYRFEYQDNELLRTIFHRGVSGIDIANFYTDKLLNIEPAYGLSLDNWHFKDDGYDRANRLSVAVNNYADVYGIPSYVGVEYINKDILTNQSTEVKRLIKCINRK